MRTILVLLLTFVFVAADIAPLIHSDSEKVVADSYIVVFKTETSQSQIDAHREKIKTIPEVENIQDFDIVSFRGYSASISSGSLDIIRSMAEVDYVEADQVVSISQSCDKQSNAVWGLNRISEVKPVLNGIYEYPTSSGSGVDAYVIDTGIEIAQNKF
jgi:hypothetical protein